MIAEIDERPFGTDFLEWMATADLTVSHAGYNTCANILQCGTRAIVVPEPSMSDQSARARRLAERGLVRALDDAECSVERLAHEMLAALATPHTRLVHGVDLDGATRTLELVERICLPALAHAAPQ